MNKVFYVVLSPSGNEIKDYHLEGGRVFPDNVSSRPVAHVVDGHLRHAETQARIELDVWYKDEAGRFIWTDKPSYAARCFEEAC